MKQKLTYHSLFKKYPNSLFKDYELFNLMYYIWLGDYIESEAERNYMISVYNYW